MEVLLMPRANAAVKQENKFDVAQTVSHGEDDDQGFTSLHARNKSYVGKSLHKSSDHLINSSSTSHEDNLVDSKEEDELESAKAEMDEVKEENERLKMMLEQIQDNYKSLQSRFFEILQQGATKKSTDSSAPPPPPPQEPELVSLSLGRSTASSLHSHDNSMNNINEKTSKTSSTKQEQDIKAGLTLGLDSKFQLSTEMDSNPISPENSSEEAPSKAQKTARNGRDHEEVAQQQGQVKRARVSVRARCDAPTMNDGCQWRKYGQKIAKGNPCPRAYYRCTVAPGCPVRKQVQRCVDDMSILITTYEGNHNHPLPVSATAMASTTSAAASMLLSGSSTSSQQAGLPSSTAPTHHHHQLINGLSFNLNDHNSTMSSRQFYLPNTNSPLFPTVTLDLTSPNSNPSTYFNRFSNFPTTSSSSRSSFPSTNLSFSSSDSNVVPTVWGNGGYPASSVYQPLLFMEKNQQAAAASIQQPLMAETLTKAITSDPSFRSVIAAAISSMVGSGGGSSSTGICGNKNENNINGSAISSQLSGLTSSSCQTGGSSRQSSSSFPFSIFNSNAVSTPAASHDHKEAERN